MNSSPANALSSWVPLGVESTGLPLDTTIAFSCPSPGVRMSSASVTTGSSPPDSGSARTRLRQRP